MTRPTVTLDYDPALVYPPNDADAVPRLSAGRPTVLHVINLSLMVPTWCADCGQDGPRTEVITPPIGSN